MQDIHYDSQHRNIDISCLGTLGPECRGSLVQRLLGLAQDGMPDDDEEEEEEESEDDEEDSALHCNTESAIMLMT